MNQLLLVIIFFSIIILGTYLNYPIENMKSKTSNFEKTQEIIDKKIEELKENSDFKKINEECSSKGIKDKNCRNKYFNMCNTNAENNICTLYDMETQTIIPRKCNSFKDNVSEIDTWEKSLQTHKNEIKLTCCDGYYYKNPVKNSNGIIKNEPINPENKSLYVIGGYDKKKNSGIRYSSPFGPNELCNNNDNTNNNTNDCIKNTERSCLGPSCKWHIDKNYNGCCVSDSFNEDDSCASDGTITLPDY